MKSPFVIKNLIAHVFNSIEVVLFTMNAVQIIVIKQPSYGLMDIVKISQS